MEMAFVLVHEWHAIVQNSLDVRADVEKFDSDEYGVSGLLSKFSVLYSLGFLFEDQFFEVEDYVMSWWCGNFRVAIGAVRVMTRETRTCQYCSGSTSVQYYGSFATYSDVDGICNLYGNINQFFMILDKNVTIIIYEFS